MIQLSLHIQENATLNKDAPTEEDKIRTAFFHFKPCLLKVINSFP